MKKTILVMEDDYDFRKIVQELLTEKGYTVLAAEDGVKGMMLYLEHKQQIDVMLIDAIMPGLCGCEVIQRIKKQVPKPKIIGMSAGDERLTGPFRSLCDLFLAKPIQSIETLYHAVE